MTSRMLKELKNLSPWQWDGKPETVGNAIVDQFEKVLAPLRGGFPLYCSGDACPPRIPHHFLCLLDS